MAKLRSLCLYTLIANCRNDRQRGGNEVMEKATQND